MLFNITRITNNWILYLFVLFKEKDTKKDGVKSDDILKRGMSLVKSYSKMTEKERIELIKKAFEAKQILEKELKETKEEVKKKDQKLEKLQKEVFYIL